MSRRSGILVKKLVLSNNSCLFSSIGYVIKGYDDDSMPSIMRQIIAIEVASDPATYNEAMLGRSNREYCEWIMQPSSWGGAIELSIFSRYYKVQFAVVDTVNGIVIKFGEGQNYKQRAFLMYTGDHYDPLYMEQHDGSQQTLFPVGYMDVYHQAEQLARHYFLTKSQRLVTEKKSSSPTRQLVLLIRSIFPWLTSILHVDKFIWLLMLVYSFFESMIP